MQIGSKTLEQDGRGAKVILLADNNILKIFRRRATVNGGLIYSNARRFCRNAERLQQLKIPTVNIIKLYHLENSTDTAVLYQPLEGVTVRNLLSDNRLTEQDCKNLGKFIAQMHQVGVYFRSLHFGNIIKTNSGKCGLIDLSDMSIYWWGLQLNTRIRNFMRIQRYDVDIHTLGEKSWFSLIQSYLDSAQLSKHKSSKILSKMCPNLTI
ncbi:MAG TPA: lipopolysaccharide kinase InaA family protein [Methylotenera sp.]|nr:lipopolysaccharide kinase InaA family protein [Methylotenera sp.]